MLAIEVRRLLRSPLQLPKGKWFGMIRADSAIPFFADRDVPRVELVVATIMALYADDQGFVVATVDDIGKACGGYSRSMIADALASLIERGILTKVKRSVHRVEPSFCEPPDKAFRSYMAAPA